MKIEKGDILESKNCVVLATADSVNQETFAGVVIKASTTDSFYPVGTYSESWGTDVFEKSDLKLDVK